jgi:hypothetical protein
MTLLEIIIYIALLVSFLVTGIFSAYSLFISSSNENNSLNETIQQTTRPNETNGGFVALVSAFTISTALLLMSIGMTRGMTVLYDLVLHKEYRAIVRGAAFTCADRALMYIEQDYLYQPETGGDYLLDFRCTIESISPATVVTSSTFQGVQGRVETGIQKYPHEIHILYQKFSVF